MQKLKTPEKGNKIRTRTLVIDFGEVLNIGPGPFTIMKKIFGKSAPKKPKKLSNDNDLWKGEVRPAWESLSEGITSYAEFCRTVSKAYGIRIDPQQILDEYFKGWQTNEGLVTLIKKAKMKGIEIAMLSNNFKELWDRWKAEDKGIDLFDHLIASHEVGMKKPLPKIYLLMFDRIRKCSDECFFVDDLDDNIKMGESLGMPGFLYDHTNLEEANRLLEIKLQERGVF